MFEDYAASGEDWMKSNIMMQTRRSTSKSVHGDETFITYKDLKTKHGTALARQIRDEKRALNNSVSSGDMPFIMPHPDCPASEERACVMFAIQGPRETPMQLSPLSTKLIGVVEQSGLNSRGDGTDPSLGFNQDPQRPVG